MGDEPADLVDGLEFLEAVGGGRKAEGGRLAHQAELGVDIFLLLFLGETMPCLTLKFIFAFLRRRRGRMPGRRRPGRVGVSWRPGIEGNSNWKRVC